MKKQKLITALCATALIGVIGVGATLAYFTDTDDTTNVITMGHVDIELTEPNFPDDKRIENVVPNQVITKDPTITVKAGSENCYLRAKVDIVFKGNKLSDDEKAAYAAAIRENINIDEELWVFGEGGYYYFKHAVGKTNNADQKFILFDTVKIPETWGNKVADATFEIVVKAEAIQADNFAPTRNAEDEIINWQYENGESISADNVEEYVAPTTPAN